MDMDYKNKPGPGFDQCLDIYGLYKTWLGSNIFLRIEMDNNKLGLLLKYFTWT